ncbi:hypothetical protein BK133_01190 [Paenibacillus sp. FSL H8-0548]|uniref:glycosyl hydrolase family 28 protein n=1 Tax=Paenibacillus sp. FSL H8-0548 TaxID=1920422 RepID=UPI00096C2AD3|nr:glycosyl hydrolase family 28 protein [Paenibacillus sp. FSL H8-0548]OMF38843.1 hypothetical protein BK133_01190 [Paenibacillus sp. FSL H8-0548]
MIDQITDLVTYPVPCGILENQTYKVRVRKEYGEWQQQFVYSVPVDMHNVRETSMVAFDFHGTVEIEVMMLGGNLEQVEIRPSSLEIDFRHEGNKVCFKLDRPAKLSLEANGDRFSNLHLFANELEKDVPDLHGQETVNLQPGNHRSVDLLERLQALKEGREERTGKAFEVLYFGAGLHVLDDPQLYVASGTIVYLAAGAVVAGSIVCSHVEDVIIRGRGLLYMREFEKMTYYRGVEIEFSRNITVEGITLVDPPHYSIFLGKSEHVTIRNFKSFSSRGWCDGIDMMSCSDISIEDVFLRTSDDCIAIYGRRWAYEGDTTNITVKNSVLWADVAHPIMIGAHGDYERNGDMIRNIVFENIDILEHHEPQDGYWGCMTINAGDKNTVSDVLFRNIRVEQFELGRLIDIRVFHNPKYNPAPGNRVENIRFENVSFNGLCDNPSIIEGFDEKRIVDGIQFVNLRINGEQAHDADTANLIIVKHAERIHFS